MRITFKTFDSKMASREKLFKAAVDFANKIDPHDLITITHSEDRDNIVLTIWYFTDEPEQKGELRGVKSVTPPAGTPRPTSPTMPGLVKTPELSPDQVRRPEQTHHGSPLPPPPLP